MSTSLHRILFGSLVLSDGTTDDPMGLPYRFSVMGENFSTGQPEAITRTIETFMLDGASVIKDGDGNRTITVYVGIHGPDTQALTDGEVALTLETGKRNSFIVEQFDGYGPPTLFEVVMSSFGQVPDDLAEVMRCERVYALNITALPQAFSTTITRTPALSSAASPAVTTISDGTSASGWTLNGGGAPTVVSGELRVDMALTSSGDPYVWGGQRVLTYTGSVDMSTEPYLAVDVRFENTTATGDYGWGVDCRADGADLDMISQSYDGTTGTTTYYFLCPDTSVTTFAFTLTWSARFNAPQGSAPTVYAFVDDLKRSDASPFPNSTARQQVRTLTLGGSVRTPGTLAIEHETSALGDVLVHTCPNFGTAFDPGTMHHYALGGGISTGQPTVSGRLASGGFSVDVPIDGMPRGTYAVVARLRLQTVPGAITLGWSAQTQLAGSPFGPLVPGPSHDLTLDETDFSIVTLGTIELPTTDVNAQTDALQRITLDGGTTNLRTDQVWLFFLADHLGNRGHLTQVACGTAAPSAGGSSNRLWLRSATIDQPLPAVFVGHAEDMTDAHFAVDALWDQHEFTPGGMVVTTVTTNAENAAVSFESRAAGHSHAPS